MFEPDCKSSQSITIIDLNFFKEVQQRLKSVYFEGQPWEEVIKAFDSPDMLFYLDPPVLAWLGEKFCRHEFKPESYKALRNRLSDIEGKFMLSYDESKDIRKLYKGFEIRSTAPVHYFGNKKRTSARLKTEIRIRNF